ncbi:rod-binding protein [Escherichia coli]|uniref:rod-binding protein n=1 Tax=Escherichia coli TaxID=562 RepID=UPI002676CB56|nr:rod-binding protein [Escherichia coli]WKU26257.1 rod-binding protein [Escherichia coli]
MFVQMMLKSMRDALPKDGQFSSEHTRLYTSMYDQQIAQQMTAGKGLGLAEMMVKQMTPEQPLLVFRRAGFSPALSLLMSAFALLIPPACLTAHLHRLTERSPTQQHIVSLPQLRCMV